MTASHAPTPHASTSPVEPVASPSPSLELAQTLVQDGAFRSGILEVLESGATARFWGYEALLILLLWNFRAWRLTKSDTFLTRMWTQAWVGFSYWFCAFFVVPCVVLGQPFRTALAHLLRAVFRHYFA